MAKKIIKNAAAVKVTEKVPAKGSVAKKVLKKVSYGAGVLVRKVRKAGHVIKPAMWQEAKKSILGVLKLSRKDKAAVIAPAAEVQPKTRAKKVAKKPGKKGVRKGITKVARKSPPKAVPAGEPEKVQIELS